MISTERTPAIRPSRVDHRRVLGLALEHVGEGVAHDVVAVEHRPERRVRPGRHGVGVEVALGEPAERPALAVDQQRVGDFGARRASPAPRRSPGPRLPRRLHSVSVA